MSKRKSFLWAAIGFGVGAVIGAGVGLAIGALLGVLGRKGGKAIAKRGPAYFRKLQGKRRHRKSRRLPMK